MYASGYVSLISEDLKSPCSCQPCLTDPNLKILVTDQLLPSDSHADNNSNNTNSDTQYLDIYIHDISDSKMIYNYKDFNNSNNNNETTGWWFQTIFNHMIGY